MACVGRQVTISVITAECIVQEVWEGSVEGADDVWGGIKNHLALENLHVTIHCSIVKA